MLDHTGDCPFGFLRLEGTEDSELDYCVWASGGLLLNAAQGFSQFSHSLLGFIVGITVFIVPFALGWMGAGDVKYFGVVGALLGVGWLPRVFFIPYWRRGFWLLVMLPSVGVILDFQDFLRMRGPIASLQFVASVECSLTLSVKERQRCRFSPLGGCHRSRNYRGLLL